MEKKIIATTGAPGAIGPYSQACEAGDFVFVSGQLPIDPATGAFPEGGIAEQTRQSLNNGKAWKLPVIRWPMWLRPLFCWLISLISLL